MALPWFRMYAEIRSDPKVRTMPEPYQLRLVWLFTMRCEGPTEDLSNDELCYGLGCDETFLSALHSAFLEKGFIEEDWSVRNWKRRQFVSDSSTERVREFRARQAQKQDETLQKRRETQNETDQNRTEQIQNRTETAVARATRLPSEWAPNLVHQNLAAELGVGIATEAEKFRDYWAAKAGAGGRKLDWDATFRNWLRTAAERKPNGKGSGHHYPTKTDRTLESARELLAQFSDQSSDLDGPPEGGVCIEGSSRANRA